MSASLPHLTPAEETKRSPASEDHAQLTLERGSDEWAVSLSSLFDGWAALASPGDAVAPLSTASEGFARLGVTILEKWSRSALALALARAGHPDARRVAEEAVSEADSAGTRSALAVAHLALAELEPARSEHRWMAEAMAAECGLTLPLRPRAPRASREAFPARDSTISFRCFGGFCVVVDDVEVDLGDVRPRARQTLRFLALHAGRPVHREVLMTALWPEAPAGAAMRRLHVALSSLRRVLHGALGPRGGGLIARDGDAYRVVLGGTVTTDVVEFDRALMRARTARAARDAEAARAAYERAWDLYDGDLLPEDGPCEWVVDERERRRGQAVHVACSLAEMLLGERRAADAARVCERGLTIDRYEDELWRLRILSLREAGHLAAAARATRDYQAILHELGVSS